MKRRIFIAIALPAALKEKVSEIIQQWQWLPIRWLKPEHWHITLIPPVYLDASELELLIALLGESRFGKFFSVRFSRIALAPPGVPARMIWLEGETPPELGQLKKKFEKVWSSASGLPPLKPETRPIALHVTIARFEPGELEELGEKTRVLGEVDFSFAAKEIVVTESHLKPSGAEYETLATIPL